MTAHNPILMVALAVILAAVAIHVSVSRYKKIGAKAALTRGVVYVLLIGSLAGIYFVLSYAISKLLLYENIALGSSLEPIDIILAMVLAFLFQPIKKFFDTYTDKIFYRNECNFEDFSQGLISSICTSSGSTFIDLLSLITLAYSGLISIISAIAVDRKSVV